MRSARPLRALLLLTLLAAGPLTMPAQAQAPETPTAQPVICFDKDAQVGGQCSGDVTPSYLQLDPVSIDIEGVAGAQLYVSARCLQGCPASDPSATKVYWVLFSGAPVVFPRDFTDPGPEGNGGNAVADKAGRYNATWEVAANVTGVPVSRVFYVWLYDAFVGTNHTLRPGESHYLRAAGFPPGADVTYRWERKDPFTGRYEVISSRVTRAGVSGTATGWLEDYFRLPASEAGNITACGKALLDCYRITISGTGKQTEVVKVQVGLAEITRGLDTTPRPGQTPNGDVNLQRTDNATFDIDLYYPGGREHLGPKLRTVDVPVSPAFGERALRVAVEKVYRQNGSVFPLGDVPLRYVDSAFVWRAQWTIPKNLTPEASTALYRLRLVEQRDLFGNRIPEDVLGNFTVGPAQIVPQVDLFFDELERTRLGTLQLGVRYHNGEPFTPADAGVAGNSSPLRGCFVRIAPPPAPPAPPPPQVDACRPTDPLTWGRYDPVSERWNFTVRFPRDHADLDPYRFILVNGTGGTTDAYDNQIFGVTTAPFQVVAAKPVVAFSTVMREREADVLERGNRIFVTTTITYHDGSPYSHSVRVNPNSTDATTLQGRLLRRGPGPGGEGYGPLAGDEPFNLTETDPSRGRWSGYLQLTDDDTNTPAGIWTFQFDVADNLTTPNANRTSFDREVVSSTIQLCPTFQPPSRTATGSTIKFRFRLFYSECDTGREVPSAAVVGKLQARVYRWDAARQTTTGSPVSNVLVPSYNADSTLDWGMEYEVPDNLFAGSYVVTVAGADTFGNKLVPSSRSRPFTTFTDIVERAVIAQPARDVKRGESATVVFDAREGDTGTNPDRLAPRIQLERFDTSTISCADGLRDGGCWVRERADVLVRDPSDEDHVGIFPVDIDTPVGLYRFSLQGRDAAFHLITGLSANFSVSPTLVSRALLTTPPERIVKGEPFTFYLEQMPGDSFREKYVFLDGRPLAAPNPQVVNEFGRVNVTWAIPFEAPVGNYTLRLQGRDVNGNDILVLTPPIEALAASLEGRLLGQPTRAVERGTVARILFAIAYPDGGFYAAQDAPRVFVHAATGPVAAANIRREGLSFAAEWFPDKDTPLGDYYFEVSSQATGGAGNSFPPLRSNAFRVVPGSVVRPAVDQLGESLERLTGAVYSVPFEPDDRFVKFDLVYYGPSLSPIVDTTRQLPEITRSPLPHTIDGNAGKYVARLVTDQESQVGTFRIEMNGEDGKGNRIFSQSRQFLVRPTTIGIQFDGYPPSTAFGEGKTIELSFVAKYTIGTLMDDSYGRPSVVALINDRPITQRPEVEYRDGHWFMSWTGPDVMPPGTYIFAVGGSDLHGNPIANARSTPYIINEGSLLESANRAIPAPSPVLLVLALVAVAALLAGRRRRDDP